MAKSKETFNKKEKEKRRIKQRQEKKERMEERKAKAKKGKSLEEMMAFIDENGNLSDTPSDPRQKKVFKVENIQIGVPRLEEQSTLEVTRMGVVIFFNDAKGFGFINDLQTNERIFIHVNNLSEQINESDKVTFETEKGPRGLSAINVRKIV